MKRLLIITVLLLLCSTVYSINAGEQHTLKTFECYGDVDIKIRGNINVQEDEYKFVGCDKEDMSKWSCRCNGNNTNIIIETKPELQNIYDIVLEYYIAPVLNITENNQTQPTQEEIQNENNRRTINLNNITVGPPPEVDEPFIMPFFDTGSGIIIVVIIVVIIVGFVVVLFLVYKYILNTEDNQVQGKEQVTDDDGNDITDDEINDIIDKYT